MHIHEYQAKLLLRSYGATVPAGRVAASAVEAGGAYDELGVADALVKAQIHAGGRGKCGGVVPVSSRREAELAARKLIGSVLATSQTGPAGLPVSKVLVEESLDVRAELYLSVSLDRESACPIVMASSRGGVDIEELSSEEPQAICIERGNPFTGLEPFQARKLAGALDLPHLLMQPMARLVTGLGKAFVELDCSLIEINPVALCADDRMVAADVKMSFDDNARRQHLELADLRDTTQEDAREVEAERFDLSYVGLQGDIGCMVNGAGLAMATMDLIRLQGGEPANFLDVGGSATADKVAAAFRLICRDAHVRSILVNIFGGIVRCDMIAQGILEAVAQAGIGVPLVVRLEGTKAREGRRALAESRREIVTADTLQEGAAKAVALAKQ